MIFNTLVAPAQVANYALPHVIVDCRSQLGHSDWGEQQYLDSHLPNAHFAHLERDLSGVIIAGKTGRHPLPEAQQLDQFFSRLGIHSGTQVFAYDQDSGAYAARLWWLLRWRGHSLVAVMDGGWKAWQKNQFPVSTARPIIAPTRFIGTATSNKTINADALSGLNHDDCLIDARGAARFAGRDETIDPVAGHIPGAHNFPFTGNLNDDLQFLGRDLLQKRFASLRDKNVISYCGSGVTACHNILAMVHAGFDEPRLYGGSWSEWICDPNRPIATGTS